MTGENYRLVRATAQGKLRSELERNNGALPENAIPDAVAKAVEFFGASDIDQLTLVEELERVFAVIIGKERILQDADGGYEPWLPKRKSEIKWRFWERYEQFLRERGWPEKVLERLGESTDQVLGLLTASDRPGTWDRRGMIVGHVQSGKTSHYNGLIAKAADAGYKLIVVLTGFHNSLRSQTQIRLEEGFLGYDRQAAGAGPIGSVVPIGVGVIDPTPKADSITTRADNGDFRRSVASNFAINPGGHPLLFVIKKNGSVLKNLLEWVRFAANARDARGAYVSRVPLLVIDDEADQGSVDTKQQQFDEDGRPDPDHDPVVLNKRIRELLRLFDQSAYVGYTATPFANIFIHDKGETEELGRDLFPRSFIVALPTPSDHVGPSRVFGDGAASEGLPIIRMVAEAEPAAWMPPKHKKEHQPRYDGQYELPPSLRTAIRAFVLACAARAARGDAQVHNSMLIHVTRFTNVQKHVAEQVRAELQQLKRRWKLGDGSRPRGLRDELRELWNTDFAPTTVAIAQPDCPPVVWDAVESSIGTVLESITVREINGAARDVLDYVANDAVGLNVIAVGGDKLSRGLTLEGLSVSYFLRASRMYDTLMQMGRWFGYRPRYLDLCRLYSTDELIDWFTQITAANEELRADFDRMVASGSTPADFGHRVRSHPGLLVTSQVKMRNGMDINVGFAGSICETVNFWRTREKLQRNWDAGQSLIQWIQRNGNPMEEARVGKAKIWRGIPAERIIEFLGMYAPHPAAHKVIPDLLAGYIREEQKQGRLTEWTILLANGDEPGDIELADGIRVNLVRRGWYLGRGSEEQELKDKERFEESNHFRIRRLLSPADEGADLSDAERAEALKNTVAAWQAEPGDRAQPELPSGTEIRAIRSSNRGLLLLYPINSRPSDRPGGKQYREDDKVEPAAVGIPILGFGISFPNVDGAPSTVRFVVNNVYWSQEIGTDDQFEGQADE